MIKTFIVWIATTAVTGGQYLTPADYGSARYAGYVADDQVTEASGMAFSNVDPDRLWLHNDSGHQPHIFAATAAGRPIAQVKINGVKNVDWEDLASYRDKEQPMLVIGDVGDNGGVRPQVNLHFVLEPEKLLPVMQLSPAWTLNIRYPDGPHDCESIAVDPEEGYLYLLTKRTKPARLYRVPLTPNDKVIEAQWVTDVRQIPQPTPQLVAAHPRTGRYRSQPTAMDFAPDLRQAVVLTYQDAYVFERSSQQSWQTAFSQAPKLLRLPLLPQGEAITYSLDGNAVYVTSEKWPSPIIRLVKN